MSDDTGVAPVKEYLHTDQERMDRYTEYSDDPDECDLWIGPTDPGGYGQVKSVEYTRPSGTCVSQANVLSLCMKLGRNLGMDEQGRSLGALHTCDTPSCVNPRHLYEGTQQDNKNDSVRRGRHARGESSGMTVLCEIDVLKIRARVDAGEMHRAIALDYGVHSTTVCRIGLRDSWKHLPEEKQA